MGIRFYDNPKTGRLHFEATSGGGLESHQTSKFDVPATEELIRLNAKEYDDYLKAIGKQRSDQDGKDIRIAHLETALAEAQRNVERLSARVAELEGATT